MYMLHNTGADLLTERVSVLESEGAVGWGSGTHTTAPTDQWRARGTWAQDYCLLGSHAGREKTKLSGIYVIVQY